MTDELFPDGWRIISEIFDPTKTLAIRRVIDFRNGESWKSEIDYRTTPAPIPLPKPPIVHMRQRWKDDCGVCSVAMAANVSWEAAEAAMFGVNPETGLARTSKTIRLTFVASDEDVIRGLKALGCAVPVARFQAVRDWAELRGLVVADYAILKLPGRTQSRWHLAAFQGCMGLVFDPGEQTEQHYFGTPAPLGVLIVRRPIQ